MVYNFFFTHYIFVLLIKYISISNLKLSLLVQIHSHFFRFKITSFVLLSSFSNFDDIVSSALSFQSGWPACFYYSPFFFILVFRNEFLQPCNHFSRRVQKDGKKTDSSLDIEREAAKRKLGGPSGVVTSHSDIFHRCSLIKIHSPVSGKKICQVSLPPLQQPFSTRPSRSVYLAKYKSQHQDYICLTIYTIVKM